MYLHRQIVVAENKIMAPKSGISSKFISAMYADIIDVNIQSVHKQRFLNILHQGGKLTIPQGMLSNNQAFEELTSLVAAKIGR